MSNFKQIGDELSAEIKRLQDKLLGVYMNSELPEQIVHLDDKYHRIEQQLLDAEDALHNHMMTLGGLLDDDY